MELEFDESVVVPSNNWFSGGPPGPLGFSFPFPFPDSERYKPFPVSTWNSGNKRVFLAIFPPTISNFARFHTPSVL